MSLDFDEKMKEMEENSIEFVRFLWEKFNPEDTRRIAEVLRRNTSVKELDLGNKHFGNEGAIALGDALRENMRLELLDLEYNNIGNEGAIAIANALRGNKTLVVLILKWNNIGKEGAIAIAEALRENKALVELNLGMNNIGKEGAIAIAEALSENKTLVELGLFGNDIGDEGCIAIAGALRKNRHLQWLYLHSCGITDKGLISLAESLKENFTLTELRVDNSWEQGRRRNIFTDEGAKALLDTLDVNMTLKIRYLEWTDVSDELQKLIRKKTRRNKTLYGIFNLNPQLGKSVSFRKTKIILLGDSGSGKTHTVRELTSEEYVEERDMYTEALEISSVNSMTWEKDDKLNARELSLASLRGELVAKEVHSHIIERRNEQIEENREEWIVLDIEEEDRDAQRNSCASHFRYLLKDRDKEKTSLSDSDEHTIVADIYDFGGHEVYRVVSQFFMNDWAVYLIVLNLEDSLDGLKELLSHYVSVVKTFAPEARLCVVGTHSTTRSVEKDELEEILEEVAGEADCPVFLVENGVKYTGEEGDDEKDRLKATVKEIIENMMQEKRPTVPLIWTRMLDHLRRKRENEGIHVVTKGELREIELGRAFDKDDEEKSHVSIVKFPPEDIDAFIQRMKEMGILYHFDTPIELNDLVILDPNWLVEGIKGVMTIKEAKKLKKENPMYATNPQWREFLSSGILTSQLMELIASVYWKGNEEWKSYFMNLLQQQSLLYRIPGGGIGEEKYVVPPLLPKKSSSSLPPMSDLFTVQLNRCYPPLEMYKLSFGLMKKRGWTYDSRSTRYSILLRKEYEIKKATLIGVSCGSSGMKQELSISILEQHKKSTLGEAVMDDILSEIPRENIVR